MTDARHVVLDGNLNTCRCTRCGESMPMPLGPVEFTVAVCRAFAQAHLGCRNGMRREQPLCRFMSPPTAPTAQTGGGG